MSSWTKLQVAIFLAVVANSGALAQDKTFELKLSHWVPPTHPLQKAMEDWGASVEKASNEASNTRSSHLSSSAAPSIITTWHATALPISPMSIPVISPADSRSFPPANCPSWLEMPKGAIAQWTRGIENTPQAK